jgi:hypothetical protein
MPVLTREGRRTKVDAARFQFNVSVPLNAGGATIAGKLAVQAARYAGCHEAGAAGFGVAVEEAVRAQVNGSAGGAVAIVVRRSEGPVEVLIGARTVALDL